MLKDTNKINLTAMSKQKTNNQQIDKILNEKKEEKISKSIRQKELTRALLNAFSSIKPTIIMAQRVQKVIEQLTEQIEVSKYLNYNFVKNFKSHESITKSGLDLNLVNQLPEKSTQLQLGSLAEKLQEVMALKNWTENMPMEGDLDESLSQSEHESDENESSGDDDREKQKEQEEIEMEYRVIQGKIGGIFRDLIGDLLYRRKNLEIIKKLNACPNENETYNDLVDCLESLKAIYLKKLSTGQDDEIKTIELQERYEENVENLETKKNRSDIELTELKLQRHTKNTEQNDEIKLLKSQIAEVERNNEDQIIQMHKEASANIAQTNEQQNNIQDKMNQQVDGSQTEIEKMQKANTEIQDLLKKRKNNSENRLENMITEYDDEMFRLSDQIKLEKDLYNAERAKYKDLADKYTNVLQRKEINTKKKDDWDIINQAFKIEEQRKNESILYILGQYNFFKEKKSKKGRRGGMTRNRSRS